MDNFDNWQKDTKQYDTWNLTEKFGSTVYRLTVYVDKTDKTVKYWVGLSSGKKRKDLDVYINKEKKSDGGLKALLWAIEKMFKFPKYYKQCRCFSQTSEYICISWADNRRRNIYQRLERYGFSFMKDDGYRILMKKL